MSQYDREPQPNAIVKPKMLVKKTGEYCKNTHSVDPPVEQLNTFIERCSMRANRKFAMACMRVVTNNNFFQLTL